MQPNNPNEPTFSQNNQEPALPPSPAGTVITPDTQPPTQPPAQQQPFTPQPTMISPTPQPVNQLSPVAVSNPGRPISKKRLIIVGVVLVLFIIGIVAIGLVSKHGKNASVKNPKSTQVKTNQIANVSKDVQIPADWVPLTVKYGFTVKAPAGWSEGFESNTTFNEIVNNTVSISKAGGEITFTGDSSTTQDDIDTSVTTGITQLANDKSQSAFNNYVNKLPETTASTYKLLGADTSKVKVSVAKLTLNGKQWTQNDMSTPGQYTRTLYYWDKDRAITFIVISDDSSKLANLADTYMYPMAASLSISPR